MSARRVMLVFGTRPEAIKMAPLVRALAESPRFEPIVVVTAQHRAMLDQVLDLFAIRPDYDLDLLRERQSLTDVTADGLRGVDGILRDARPDVVVVQGDTTTTFVGALGAFYHGVPVAHVEAGLRTRDRRNPFPEEVNRRLTSQLTDYHFPPTASALSHLLQEGVARERVLVTGNTVIDALDHVLAHGAGPPDALRRLEAAGPVLLVTAHRRESWGEGMRAIGEAIRDIALREPNVSVVFPIHRNPIVREAIVPLVTDLPNVHLVEPLPYDEFAWTLARSTLVLTDSGGIQEEAPSLGKPVLVMRATTERPEAVAAGTVRLIGTSTRDIVDAVSELLRDETAYAAMSNAVNPYGDGRAAERIVAGLGHWLLGESRPAEFGRMLD